MGEHHPGGAARRRRTPRVGSSEVVGAQVHGGEVIGTLDRLRTRVAAVLTVAPYRWALPEDLRAAEAVVTELVSGRVQVVAQTSAPSARNLVAVADGMGLRRELIEVLRGPSVCVASVGPVTARAFDEIGVGVDLMPARARTADLLREIVHWATVRPAPAGAVGDTTGA